MLLAVARMLKALARQQGVAVLGTNHTQAESARWKHAERPALGVAWSNQPDCRIMVTRSGDTGGAVQRRAELVASIGSATTQSCGFHISQVGAHGDEVI